MHLFNPAFVAPGGGTPQQLQDQRVSMRCFGSLEQHAAFAACGLRFAQGLAVRENWR